MPGIGIGITHAFRVSAGPYVDTDGPTISGWTVNAAGTEITGTLSETGTSNNPTASQFSLTGTTATAGTVAVSGTTITVTLTTTEIIAAGATITISYTGAGATKILDALGNAAPAFSGAAVTNNSDRTPQTIVTSVTWLGVFRADQGVTIATGVSAWVNQKSGGACGDYAQGTAGSQPTWSATGGPQSNACITGDGTADFLNLGSWNPPAPGTTPTWHLIVGKQVTWTSLDDFFGSTTTVMRLGQRVATPSINMNNGAGVNTDGNMTVNTFFAVQVFFSATTSDFIKVGTNAKTTGSSAGTADPAAGAFSLFASAAAGGSPSNLAVCEHLVAAGEPSGAELTELNKYLRGRYGSVGAIA
jgi:hypothetical protein